MPKRPTSAFLKEVSEQPEAMRQLAAFYRGDGMVRLERWAAQARMAGRVVFAGMGTSEFAAESVLDSLARQGVDATAMDAGELLHYPRRIHGLPVLISQSGESVETRRLAEVIAAARAAPTPITTIAITNNRESALARLAGVTLPMCAGEETAISTKTYTNTLALLFLMAQALAGSAAVRQGLDRLEQLAEVVGAADPEATARAADLLADASALHVISRGPAMAAAKQTALTFMEGARIPCAPFTGGVFRHGPMEMVDAGHHSIIFVPGGEACDLLRALAAEVAAKGGQVVVITDQDMPCPEGDCAVLTVLEAGEELFPLAAATTQELLLDALARRRGLVAGEFRYLPKVTMEE